MSVIDDFATWWHEQVRKTAYLKWEQAGRPQNQDLYFWKEAEKEFQLPQAIAEPWGSGYGADDPFLKKIIEDYKARHQ